MSRGGGTNIFSIPLVSIQSNVKTRFVVVWSVITLSTSKIDFINSSPLINNKLLNKFLICEPVKSRLNPSASVSSHHKRGVADTMSSESESAAGAATCGGKSPARLALSPRSWGHLSFSLFSGLGSSREKVSPPLNILPHR